MDKGDVHVRERRTVLRKVNVCSSAVDVPPRFQNSHGLVQLDRSSNPLCCYKSHS